MGILDRIREEALSDMVARGELEEAARDRETESHNKRIEVVKHKLQVVANSLSLPVTRLTVGVDSFPQHFRLEDVIVAIRPYGYVNELPDPTTEQLKRDLRSSLYAALVALAPDKRLAEIRVGMLTTLEYRSIARAVTGAPADYDFRADAVLPFV